MEEPHEDTTNLPPDEAALIPVRPDLCPELEIGIPFDVWVVHSGATEHAGGRPDPSLVFTREGGATKAARGHGWFGGHADVSKFRAIRGADGNCYFIGNAIDDIDLARSEHESRIREAALSKLSDVERRVLGLGNSNYPGNTGVGYPSTEV